MICSSSRCSTTDVVISWSAHSKSNISIKWKIWEWKKQRNGATCIESSASINEQTNKRKKQGNREKMAKTLQETKTKTKTKTLKIEVWDLNHKMLLCVLLFLRHFLNIMWWTCQSFANTNCQNQMKRKNLSETNKIEKRKRVQEVNINNKSDKSDKSEWLLVITTIQGLGNKYLYILCALCSHSIQWL